MNAPVGLRTAIAALTLLLLALPIPAPAAKSDWLSPATLAAAPDGKTLFVACVTGKRVLALDIATRRVQRSFSLPNPPTGLAVSADGRMLYVTCAAPESVVCAIDLTKGRIAEKWPAGHSACSPVLSPDGRTLFVCNRFNNDVSAFDLPTRKLKTRIPVQREPVAAAITHDGTRLLVANHLHSGRADAERVNAVVSVIDTARGQVIQELSLPSGSGLLNDVCISPDGKYAVVTHIFARFHLPTTQLERGWVNTNGKTLIDLDKMEVLNTVLLDNIDRGAAYPWGAAWSADGGKLVVAIAGTHEVSVTDFPRLLEKLSKLSQAPNPATNGAYPAVSTRASDVPNDLSTLVGVRERRPLPEGDLGPRGVVVVGRTAYTANYFSDSLTALELDGERPKAETIPLGPKPKLTAARQGELYFNDARLCFQQWQSCASCHSDDARVDGLNWDLLNDGIGNPKNNKSLLLAFKTPPAMSTGVRESAEAAVRAGLTHILFTVQPPAVSAALDAYIQSLRPVPSPQLARGKLSAAARRGEKIFRSAQTGCANCHPGPLFTDLKSYDVGTRGARDNANDLFDTPTLVEVWRTAPYLHDGSAATMREVLTSANHRDEHGKTSQLTADELNDLIAYVLSL